LDVTNGYRLTLLHDFWRLA